MGHRVQRLKGFNLEHPMIIRALVGIVLYILLLFLLWWFIKPDPGDATQKKDFAQLMAQIAGGLALLFGLYFTWRRVEISQRTLETQQDQQVTERFTQAIDQLGATDDKGNKRMEIRLGGIYALERIARDSERDHWPIMETLTTYVREHAPWPPKERSQDAFFSPHLPITQSQGKAPNNPERPEYEINPPPEPDIQAILTVLRRRTRYLDNGEGEHLALYRTALMKAKLSEAHLEGADLSGAHLEGANFRGAHLEGAFFLKTHLEKAFLPEAHLEGAFLFDTHLEEASLVNAHLEGAFLNGAHLEGAYLSRAHLEGAHLEDVNITQEQIEQAIGDEATELPKHLTRPARGVPRSRKKRLNSHSTAAT